MRAAPPSNSFGGGVVYYVDMSDKSTHNRNIEKRVLKAVPHWKMWPRQLRQVYTLLPSHGSGTAGLKSMCLDLGMTYDDLEETMKESDTFTAALEAYRVEQGYPRFPRSDGATGNRIRHAQILWLYRNESAAILYMQVEKALQGGKPAPASLTMLREGGMFEGIGRLDDDPSVKFFNDLPSAESVEAEDNLPSFE